MEPHRMSENGKYVVFLNNPRFIYIKDTPKSPHPWLSLVGTHVYGYYPYYYNHILDPNDCLQFAESLTLGELGYKGKKCILKEKGSSLAFGVSDSRNIEIATGKGTIENEHANPTIGESYAIVRRTIIEGEAPYHIAYVLFKDGNTNITLEADAGDPELTHPIFDMYSTSDPTKSFHARYKDIYAPAVTVVLTKR